MRCGFVSGLAIALSLSPGLLLCPRAFGQFEDPEALGAIAYQEGYQQALRDAQRRAWAQAAKAAWDAAPKVPDNDGKGFTQKLGDASRGARKDGLGYFWVKNGDWQYYRDSKGIAGVRYNDVKNKLTRFEFQVPSGTGTRITIYQSGEPLLDRTILATRARTGCRLVGLTPDPDNAKATAQCKVLPLEQQKAPPKGPTIVFQRSGPYVVPVLVP
jgi:hypothetical protein